MTLQVRAAVTTTNERGEATLVRAAVDGGSQAVFTKVVKLLDDEVRGHNARPLLIVVLVETRSFTSAGTGLKTCSFGRPLCHVLFHARDPVQSQCAPVWSSDNIC